MTKVYNEILGKTPECRVLPKTMHIRTQRSNKGQITDRKPCFWLELKSGAKQIVFEEDESGTIRIELSDSSNIFIKRFTLDELFSFIKKHL